MSTDGDQSLVHFKPEDKAPNVNVAAFDRVDDDGYVIVDADSANCLPGPSKSAMTVFGNGGNALIPFAPEIKKTVRLFKFICKSGFSSILGKRGAPSGEGSVPDAKRHCADGHPAPKRPAGDGIDESGWVHVMGNAHRSDKNPGNPRKYWQRPDPKKHGRPRAQFYIPGPTDLMYLDPSTGHNRLNPKYLPN